MNIHETGADKDISKDLQNINDSQRFATSVRNDESSLAQTPMLHHQQDDLVSIEEINDNVEVQDPIVDEVIVKFWRKFTDLKIKEDIIAVLEKTLFQKICTKIENKIKFKLATFETQLEDLTKKFDQLINLK